MFRSIQLGSVRLTASIEPGPLAQRRQPCTSPSPADPVAGPHHRTPQYRKASALMNAASAADPSTRCRWCQRTLSEHPNHNTGAPPRWHAGHINPGELNGPLAPEVSTCNQSDPRNERTEPHSRNW